MSLYTCENWPGVAVYIAQDDDVRDDAELGPDWGYVVMVGDDTRHLVERDSLTEIGDPDDVCSCGAVGCWSPNNSR